MHRFYLGGGSRRTISPDIVGQAMGPPGTLSPGYTISLIPCLPPPRRNPLLECFLLEHVIIMMTAMRMRKSPPTAIDIPMMEFVDINPFPESV